MATAKTSKQDAAHSIEHRSTCPVARTLDLMGDRWTLLVMRDALFFNCKTFADFSASKERIPTNLLSNRLQKLVAQGLLSKALYQERPPRYEYLPTELGRALKPVLRAMKAFGEDNLGGKAPR
ncbi:MAG: helix-turn-helix transcriptional regulator [Pseudomonadaceae bacterium]|nr:helix-turn-helix transcriptional regulator [Pseudomonadaceae bacterium]